MRPAVVVEKNGASPRLFNDVYMVCINRLNWFKTFEHTITHQVRTVFSSLSVSSQVEVPSNSCKMLQTSLQLVYFKLLGA